MPLSVLALAVTVVIAVAFSPALARWLATRRSIATLLLFGFGLVISATLMPTAEALDGEASDGVCDLSRIGFAHLDTLTRVNTTSLNVLLFIPLGVAVGLLNANRASGVVATAAISLTFLVEAVQLVVTPLGRGCQAADIFDNLLGLAIGFTLGVLTRLLFVRTRPSSG